MSTPSLSTKSSKRAVAPQAFCRPTAAEVSTVEARSVPVFDPTREPFRRSSIVSAAEAVVLTMTCNSTRYQVLRASTDPVARSVVPTDMRIAPVVSTRAAKFTVAVANVKIRVVVVGMTSNKT